MTLSDSRRAEINVILAEIKSATRYLNERGLSCFATDPRDVLDAVEIIQRIERTILANMQEAAE